MKRLAAITALAAGAILVPAGAIQADAAMAPPASVVPPAAVEVAAHLAPTWHERTCAAFAAWDRYRTAAHLDTLAADSFHVAWRYLGADVWGLVADVRGGSVKYVTADKRYIAEDCSK